MKQFIRNYLTFNKRERNGIVILIGIITLQLLYLTFSHHFIKPEVVDFTAFEKQVQIIEAASKKEKAATNFNASIVEDNESAVNNDASEAILFKFDPNNLPEQEWKRLGFSEKQIRSIKNYENKGGKFFTKEDVKKMYCISPKQYAALQAYIDIPERKSKSVAGGGNQYQPTSTTILELNTADSSQLEQLKGIGAFYARSIIKLRNSLGGFVHREQLLELWKFDEDKLKSIQENSTIDVSKVKKKNINTFTSKELKHPYLSWNQVNSIINYRNKHGNYKAVDEIKNTDVIDEETYRKIVPYLTI
jgi:competence protein ComEA